MDNITHSLIGLAAGRTFSGFSKKTLTSKQRSVLFLTSVFANNAPDADILISPLLGDGKLGGLLHHRGFTHTLLAAPLLGLAAAALACVMLRFTVWGKNRASRSFLMLLWLVGTIGIALHVTADSWNDYGVHPFAPFCNLWFYGDMLFIIEPLLWLALGWALVPARDWQPGPWARICRQGLVILSLGLLWFFPGVSWPVAVMATAWAVLLWLVHSHLAKRKFVLWGWIPVFVVLFAFAAGSRAAKQHVYTNVSAQVPVQNSSGTVTGVVDPTVHVLKRTVDLLTSPSASNPWCWRTLVSLVELDEVGAVSAESMIETHLGFVSLWPQVFDPKTCHVRRPQVGTATLFPTKLLSDPKVYWLKTAQVRVSELNALADQSCAFDKYLNFARFPFIKNGIDGVITFGDLRYDFDQTAGFATFIMPASVSQPQLCLSLTAPWETRLRALLK